MNEELVRLQPLNPHRDCISCVRSFSLEIPTGSDEPDLPEWASVGILTATMNHDEVSHVGLCCGHELTAELGLTETTALLGTLLGLLNSAVLCLSLDHGLRLTSTSTATAYLISPSMQINFLFRPEHYAFREA